MTSLHNIWLQKIADFVEINGRYHTANFHWPGLPGSNFTMAG